MSSTPCVLNAVRRVNRAIFNPLQMKSAGTPGAYASVIRHHGRTSGRPYETPVGAVTTDDGFVIVLVYGSNTDWLKNCSPAGPPPSSTKGTPTGSTSVSEFGGSSRERLQSSVRTRSEPKRPCDARSLPTSRV